MCALARRRVCDYGGRVTHGREVVEGYERIHTQALKEFLNGSAGRESEIGQSPYYISVAHTSRVASNRIPSA